MRPLSIADYLDRLGSSAEEKGPPRPEGSPFRPRSLPSPQTAASGAKPVFDRITNKGGETQGEEAPRRTPWAPKPVLLESAARGSPPTGEPAKPEDMAAKLADAYARGREQGLSEGRVDGADRHAAELAAARELAETQQQEFRLKELAELEGAIQSGIKEIEDNVGAAVTRILAPFLSQQVVKRAVDELARAIARIAASTSPGLIKISRTRARACAPAPSESSICRSRSNMSRMTERKPSSRPTPRGLSPSFARGPSCWPRSRPERSR